MRKKERKRSPVYTMTYTDTVPTSNGKPTNRWAPLCYSFLQPYGSCFPLIINIFWLALWRKEEGTRALWNYKSPKLSTYSILWKRKMSYFLWLICILQHSYYSLGCRSVCSCLQKSRHQGGCAYNLVNIWTRVPETRSYKCFTGWQFLHLEQLMKSIMAWPLFDRCCKFV